MRPTDMAAIHSDEFKRDAVSIAQTSGLTRRQVASDLGVGLSTLNKWVKMVADEAGPPGPDQNLIRENERLRQETGRWANNRAENSRQPFRRRERAMLRFRRVRTLQKFASVHASVHNHFNKERTLSPRTLFKLNRAAALTEWRGLCAGQGATGLGKHRPVRISLPAPGARIARRSLGHRTHAFSARPDPRQSLGGVCNLAAVSPPGSACCLLCRFLQKISGRNHQQVYRQRVAFDLNGERAAFSEHSYRSGRMAM